MSATTFALLILGPTAVQAQPTVKKQQVRPFSAAELGFQSTVYADGASVTGQYHGPVIVVQAGHWHPLVGVFQFGVGAGLDEDPENPDKTRAEALFFCALGARLRPLEFVRKGRPGLIDLFVGPLVSIFGNADIVTLAAGGEVGVALHLGRIRLGLQVHVGWAKVLQQAVPDRLSAQWSAGGQLTAGLTF